MPNPPHSVLIPVGNPARVAEYIALGARIVRKLESELVLLSIELTRHEMQEMSEEEEIAGEPPAVLQKAQAAAQSFDVPVRLSSLKAHEVAEAIVSAAQDPAIDYLIMGWRGDEEGGSTVIGRSIDGLIREADAHSIIMQKGPVEESEHVLIPVLNAKLPPLALAVASLLARGEDARVTVLHLSPGPLPEEDQEAFRSSLFSFDKASETGFKAFIGDSSLFQVEFEVTDNPHDVLVTCSEGCDRLILEASQAHVLTEKVYGEASAGLAEEAQCSLVFVRPKNTGLKFGL